MLPVSQIRPHRNPVQSNNNMRLLRARSCHPGLPNQERQGRPAKMRGLQRPTRSLEQPMPYQETGGEQGQSSL
ncbi:hypothetical protein FOVG_19181 [Fusarium oxysporum f. sp. pisi HDV247]|uniref:Uncharacterized protein n=1 Tax=Fusarium oxysporum f. sp. pisi HDV247 TaxID=1080344 RepID=W9NH52_FUSOX|nr:hypothetical protein FOVG_19181 [Fusarium oxysporum f. sp. pisi HDV247]